MKQKVWEESPYDIVQIHIGAAADGANGCLRYLPVCRLFDTVRGKKQARQAAEKRKLEERKKARKEGFTIHIPDPIEQSDRNTHR